MTLTQDLYRIVEHRIYTGLLINLFVIYNNYIALCSLSDGLVAVGGGGGRPFI